MTSSKTARRVQPSAKEIADDKAALLEAGYGSMAIDDEDDMPPKSRKSRSAANSAP